MNAVHDMIPDHGYMGGTSRKTASGAVNFLFLFYLKYLVALKLPFFVPMVWDLQLSLQQDRARAILSLLAIVMAKIRDILCLDNGNPCHSR